MNENYSQLDIGRLPRWAFKRYKKSKGSKKDIIELNTPIQPTATYEQMHHGVPEGFMLTAPIASKKSVKRYIS